MAKYNEKELADTSKFLSFVLRHGGIQLTDTPGTRPQW